MEIPVSPVSGYDVNIQYKDFEYIYMRSGAQPGNI